MSISPRHLSLTYYSDAELIVDSDRSLGFYSIPKIDRDISSQKHPLNNSKGQFTLGNSNHL